MENVVKRFLKYVEYDTRSDESSTLCPSTKGQSELGKYLVVEARNIGLQNITIDDNGYVMAEIPSNSNKNIPSIGFIAHMDTSPDMSGRNVNANFVKNYDGKDIILNREKNIVLSPGVFPELLNYVGQDIITTDGTTLLGADDKSGIAEIMTVAEHLTSHPEIKHGTVKICFTPDEEIGKGADNFDVVKFGANFAYTIDGGQIGELEYENFNAASAKITITGRNVHTGNAKNKMINAVLVAMEFHSLLPLNEAPQYTEEYEGFFHLNSMEGNVEGAKLYYLIRDHDMQKFENKKKIMQKAADYINDKYGSEILFVEIKDQYYNMKEKISPVFNIVETAKKAMEEVGVEPLINPIRGGTDGARLSYMGLPTPNLFTGGHNFHGKYEYIPENSMVKAVNVILKIIELYSK
jgi:tripeptide aminopeptidase